MPASNNKLLEWWPLYTAIAGGLIAWGTLSADVNRLQKDVDNSKTDHDLVVELRTEQRHIASDVSEIKQSVKDLANDSSNGNGSRANHGRARE
jgi:outer membrane murein-binding lipoprotein Lpp